MIQHLERPKKRIGLAILIMVFASLTLAIQAMFVKLASPYLSTNFLCFARSFVNLAMLLVWVFLSPTAPKVSKLFATKAYSHHAVRSVFGVAALFCFYYSITKLSLATGTLIFYSFPLFVPLASRLWLRVKFVHRLWWGLGIAFLGLLFVLRPGEHLFNPMVIVPLIGAMFAGTAIVAVRTLSYTEPWETITAYYFTLSVVVTAIVLFLFPSSQEIYTDKSLGFAFLAGFFAAVFQILLTIAGKFAPMRLASPFVYLSFVFGAIIQYLIWGDTVPHGVILGFLLILIGTVLLVFLYPKNDLQFHPKKEKK
ncbi:MAG: DMT family transporter [Chlamydiia bacterium]|nr:DMT family transporter [Chlamydiia bacterium]